jgi:hypothetical protein
MGFIGAALPLGPLSAETASTLLAEALRPEGESEQPSPTTNTSPPTHTTVLPSFENVMRVASRGELERASTPQDLSGFHER